MNRFAETLLRGVIGTTCLVLSLTATALESDRQKPLEIFADGGSGSFGDGTSVLTGNVRIQQGSLLIQAEEAEFDKQDGKVTQVVFRGGPARLEQEIEEQGLVQAEASVITYFVGPGRVELSGSADVTHPQYQISGALLTYDLNRQHFEGSGDDSSDGRIQIRMDPEVANPALSTPGPDSPGSESMDSDALEDEAGGNREVPERDVPGRY